MINKLYTDEFANDARIALSDLRNELREIKKDFERDKIVIILLRKLKKLLKRKFNGL